MSSTTAISTPATATACTCLDLKTGKKKWIERGVGGGYLCWADGMLYTFSKGGEAGLCTCSPDGLKVTGRMRIAGDGAGSEHARRHRRPAVLAARQQPVLLRREGEVDLLGSACIKRALLRNRRSGFPARRRHPRANQAGEGRSAWKG